MTDHLLHMTRFDFRTLVEHLPVVVYVDELDESSSPLYVSPQIERMLGYTPAEWLADPGLFISCIHPHDREGVLAAIATRNSRGLTTPESEYRLIGRDGRVVWVRDDEIVVNGAAHGFLQDITSHKQDGVRLELLVGILSLAANETPPDEIVAHAAERLVELFGDVNVSYVERLDETSFNIRYTTHPGKQVFGDEVEWGAAYIARLEAGAPIVAEDVTTEAWLDPIRERLVDRSVASFVDVPLLRYGKLHGVLWFNSSRPRTWGEHEVSLLVDVAGQLAIVLTNARANEQRLSDVRDLRSRDAILEAVSHGARELVATPSWRDAAQGFVDDLGEATGASRCYMFETTVNSEGEQVAYERFEWVAAGITPQIGTPALQPLSFGERGLTDFANRVSRDEIVTANTCDLSDHERAFFELGDVCSVITVPIFAGAEWWGFIGFDDCRRERVWSAAETDALRAAAGLISAAVHRDLTERGLRRRDAVLEAVSRSAERLVAEPSWRDAAPLLLRELGEATEASRSYLFEAKMQPDGRRTVSQRFEWVAPGITSELANEVMQDMSFAEVGLARLEQLSLLNESFSASVSDLPAGERELFEAQEIRSLMTVPIFVAGEWWGFIGFDDCVTERAWSSAETEALRTGASLIEAAIERERYEVTLREHEQKLRAVFDTALDAIFITDDDRNYVDVNPAACEYVGVARRDLIGRRVDDFLPPNKLATVEEDWATYLAGGPVLEEWETQRSDGTIRTAEASARPHFIPGLHIAFLRDVTKRKQLEDELLNAQKLESLGRLAGGIAHDFNNLLTGISGYASLVLERANGDDELHRDVGEIKRAADRAAELTKQLLAFGRRQMFRPRPLDLNVVLTEVAGLLHRLLGDHVELVVRPGAELGAVQADPGQVEQVIVNLVVNARDAMPAGGRVTIETRNADDDWVELVVADDGVGMDESTRAQIFEPFFTTRDEGVGLGLASVYGIVHQSGGDVAVESHPGAGAVFTVRLPRVYETAEIEPAPATTAPDTRQASETVLLVEDEDVVRDLARRVLERHGYTVFACAHGAEAVELSESHEGPIDLLLTDVVMPGLRGYEVARKVVATRPEIKVLYMSGYAEEALGGGPGVGGSALIEKPFAIDALARRVREMLEPTSG